MEALHQLPSTDLEAMVTALRGGRLDVPYSEFAIQRYSRALPKSQVSQCLNRLAGEGLSSSQIALILSAIIETRNRNSPALEGSELVWTGPEIAGAINRDTGAVVRDLFGRATREVLVAGFAVYQGKEVFRRLAERMVEIPELGVRFFLDIRRNHGDTTLASELVWKFVSRFRSKEWPGEQLPELYYDPRSLDENQEKRSSLHAKCVLIDRKVAFVTSANFTEAAQERNIEVGALIKSTAYASDLHRQFDLLVEANALVRVLVPSG